MWKKNITFVEAADLIERFLKSESQYPQEWTDFIDTPQQHPQLETYRRRCSELDAQISHPGDPDSQAVSELKQIIGLLRTL
jgi:hypothetical protein